jgi:hypothetical protein
MSFKIALKPLTYGGCLAEENKKPAVLRPFQIQSFNGEKCPQLVMRTRKLPHPINFVWDWKGPGRVITIASPDEIEGFGFVNVTLNPSKVDNVALHRGYMFHPAPERPNSGVSIWTVEIAKSFDGNPFSINLEITPQAAQEASVVFGVLVTKE